MKFAKDTSGIERYIAIDIHKEYALVGGQNARQDWVMQPRRIGIERFGEWAEANLGIGDAVVLETTTNVWDIYDIVAPLVNYTVVAHASGVRQIAEARVKTDKKDIERLLRLLIADIVPEVWVPPAHVRVARDELLSTSAGEDQHDDTKPFAEPDPPSQFDPAEGCLDRPGLVGGTEDQWAGEDPDPAGTGHAG